MSESPVHTRSTIPLCPEQVRLEELVAAVKRAGRTVDRLRRLGDFLEYVERWLPTPNRQLRSDLMTEVGHLLAEGQGEGPLWDWLRETARSADLERQVLMRITIFECAPEHPIFWPDVYRLWDMWFDPAARWAVYAAYWRFPRRVYAHLQRYSAHHRRCHLPVPQFSQQEFDAVLKRHHEYRDSNTST